MLPEEVGQKASGTLTESTGLSATKVRLYVTVLDSVRCETFGSALRTTISYFSSSAAAVHGPRQRRWRKRPPGALSFTRMNTREASDRRRSTQNGVFFDTVTGSSWLLK